MRPRLFGLFIPGRQIFIHRIGVHWIVAQFLDNVYGLFSSVRILRHRILGL